MKLVTDTNILVRCCQGRAMRHVLRLRKHGVELLTTDYHAHECHGVLAGKLGLAKADADVRTQWALRPFEVLELAEYLPLRSEAEVRLDKSARADWPGLAAALALDVGIWSDDRDFFGVGVPIWSTGNVHYATVNARGASHSKEN